MDESVLVFFTKSNCLIVHLANRELVFSSLFALGLLRIGHTAHITQYFLIAHTSPVVTSQRAHVQDTVYFWTGCVRGGRWGPTKRCPWTGWVSDPSSCSTPLWPDWCQCHGPRWRRSPPWQESPPPSSLRTKHSGKHSEWNPNLWQQKYWCLLWVSSQLLTDTLIWFLIKTFVLPYIILSQDQ